MEVFKVAREQIRLPIEVMIDPFIPDSYKPRHSSIAVDHFPPLDL